MRHETQHAGPTKEELWFFASIGRLVVGWAHVEAGLDLLINDVHRNGGREIAGRRPRNLKDKISYLRRILVAGADDGKIDPGMESLLDRVQSALAFRHDIIHGILTGHQSTELSAEISRLVHSEDQLGTKTINVEIRTILQEANKADRWALEFFKWHEKLTEEIIRWSSEHMQK